MDFVAIDFETANFKRSSACSLGLAVVEGGRITDIKHWFIKPTPSHFEPICVNIHGISPSDVETSKGFDEVWSEVKPFIEKKIVVAHNASFDLSVLRNALDSYGLPHPTLTYYCSMILAKSAVPGLINYKLPTVCRHLGINNLNHHEATSDASSCALAIIKLAEKGKATCVKSLMDSFGISAGKLDKWGYRPVKGVCSTLSGVVSSARQPNLFEEFIDRNICEKEEHPFYGKRVVFTGALNRFSREAAMSAVERIGGLTKPANLSSKTNFLVVGGYGALGEDYKSAKMEKAEELIKTGHELEVLSENDFLELLMDGIFFEITAERIEQDSNWFMNRNKFNEFSQKNVFFSDGLSMNRLEAFQLVGNCSGFGHDYDMEVLPHTDYFIISNSVIGSLKQGIKDNSIIKIETAIQEQISKGSSGALGAYRFISEEAFVGYIENRGKHISGERPMAIHEWDVLNEYRNE